MPLTLADHLSRRLEIPLIQIQSTLKLIEEGATIPFIARYRKEVTGGLDDTQLRDLAEQYDYFSALDARRKTLIEQIRKQDKLTSELETAILDAETKARLEDLYAPYKPKRRNKAHEAREAGLEALVNQILQSPQMEPTLQAQAFICPEKGFATLEKVMDGARAILMEALTEHADLLSQLRHLLWQQGCLFAKSKGDENPQSKFRDYFNFQQDIRKIPSHRALALLRGQHENELTLSLSMPEASIMAPIQALKTHNQLHRTRCSDWLEQTVQQSWKQKLFPSLEKEMLATLRDAAENEAIVVFAKNLRDLLMAPPAGGKTTLALDPGLRTGTKVAVINHLGELLETDTLYPHPPHNQQTKSAARIQQLIRKYQVHLVAIGNGTASRETDAFVRETLQLEEFKTVVPVVVSEAGASVYSASALAAAEFPNLDVTLRGAVSIGRRLQDPLAELVKIDPKSIGVGQYQHDVDQKALSRKLADVVEDCVNQVGVDVNMASTALLERIAGLNKALAENIVQYRREVGGFTTRKQLLKVPKLGPKAFEQAAGFLRIRQGAEVLDNTAVHPESYPLVKKMAAHWQLSVAQLMQHPDKIRQTQPSWFTPEFGSFTVTDVLRELEKPGRDPRPDFVTVQFDAQVHTLQDLYEGMRLQGVVTNVTNFGAFVDVGVHQDGLVHISQLADYFVKDPHQVVSTGQIVEVMVLEVDENRQRISLTMKKKQ